MCGSSVAPDPEARAPGSGLGEPRVRVVTASFTRDTRGETGRLSDNSRPRTGIQRWLSPAVFPCPAPLSASLPWLFLAGGFWDLAQRTSEVKNVGGSTKTGAGRARLENRLQGWGCVRAARLEHILPQRWPCIEQRVAVRWELPYAAVRCCLSR